MTPEKKLNELLQLRSEVEKLTNEVYETVIEIPIDFLTKKGFKFTKHTPRDGYGKKDITYSFTYKNFKGSIQNYWYYNRISIQYSSDVKTVNGCVDFKNREWSFLKTDFETYYNRQLKKDFEPTVKTKK